MLFRVAAWDFRVRITDEPLVDAEGNRAAGMALWDEREILLAAPPTVPVRNRLEVLLHELKEAWLFYVPRPRGKEEECNLTAVVAAGAMADLERQGGVASLEALTIHTPPDAATPDVANRHAECGKPVRELRYVPMELPARQVRHVAHGGRADCAVCGTLFSGAQIVTGPMRWDADLQGGVVDRALYCAGCEHVQRWVEGIDLDGRPNGSAVGEPELVREPGDIDRFLEEHPEAAGMAVA